MKILMATMALDIGGAETHIVELAKELVRQGHEILVASNGGVYVSELKAAGISHFDIPMHRRNLGAMLQSRKEIAALIKQEKPDIVHAHARIPAFVCGTVTKKLGVPFMTTCHGVYNTGLLLKILSNWGEHTLAVSEDVQSYLTQTYNLGPNQISLTINAIDTERFAPRGASAALRESLGIGNGFVLCHVSRLDEEPAIISQLLIKLAPELADKSNGLQILIVGSGTEYERLYAEAAHVNKALGYSCIVMTGQRTDVAELLSLADGFAGVSRAALEAMASGLPTVLSGAQGHCGLFSLDKLEEAMATNFCCRTDPPVSEKRLEEDLLKLLCLPDYERAKLGGESRQMVCGHYSIGRMAADSLLVYEQLRKRKYKVLLSGYYGFSNAGDDAILQSIHEGILSTGHDVDITVLSNNPESTSAQYGLKALPRFHFWMVLKALWHCDALVSGGGSLLQDRTSTRSILYYLSLIKGAQLLGKPVMLYANGIGPVQKPANRRRVKKIVEKAALVTLRDVNSAKELEAMDVRRPPLHVTADPVFNLAPASEEKARELLNQCGISDEKPFVAISVRPWPGSKNFHKDLAALCDHLYTRYALQILFLPMQPAKDISASLQVSQYMQSPFSILGSDGNNNSAEGNITPGELMAVLGTAKLCVAMRLHTLIFATRMATPILGLVYDPKVASYLEELNMPSAGNVSDFSLPDAIYFTDKVLAEYDEIKANLSQSSQNLAKAALANDRMLLEMLEENSKKHHRS